MRQAAQQKSGQFGDDLPESGSRSLAASWQNVRARLKAELGRDIFRTWFAGVACAGRDGDRICLAMPSKFRLDWIATHYEDRVRQIWQQEEPGIKVVEFRLAAPGNTNLDFVPDSAGTLDPTTEEAGIADGALQRKETSNDSQSVAAPRAFDVQPEFDLEQLGAPLDPRYTFSEFVSGESNALALSAAKQVALSPAQAFNPLYLYGQVGIGKTHLLHAIAWDVRRNDPGARILYLSAERFMYRFVQALRQKDILTFKEHLRGVDILLLDDIQFIANKASTQEEFFHTFDALIGTGRQVVISADRAPSDLSGVGERIRSRLGQGLTADIRAADFDLRLGILQHKLTMLQKKRSQPIDIPKGVLEFIAHKLVSNIRVLEGALTRLVAHASLVDRPVTIDLAKDILSDLFRTGERKITIDDIQRSVVRYFNLNMSDLVSARRAREVARPRQIAMYLCKQLTTRSLPEIGRKFGGRDHTTVIHAVRKVEELRAGDRVIDGDVEALRREISGGIGR